MYRVLQMRHSSCSIDLIGFFFISHTRDLSLQATIMFVKQHFDKLYPKYVLIIIIWQQNAMARKTMFAGPTSVVTRL